MHQFSDKYPYKEAIMLFRNLNLTKAGKKLISAVGGIQKVKLGACAIAPKADIEALMADNSAATIKPVLTAGDAIKAVAHGVAIKDRTKQLLVRAQVLAGQSVADGKLSLVVVANQKVITSSAACACCGPIMGQSVVDASADEVAEGENCTILGWADCEEVVQLPNTDTGFEFDIVINVEEPHDCKPAPASCNAKEIANHPMVAGRSDGSVDKHDILVQFDANTPSVPVTADLNDEPVDSATDKTGEEPATP